MASIKSFNKTAVNTEKVAALVTIFARLKYPLKFAARDVTCRLIEKKKRIPAKREENIFRFLLMRQPYPSIQINARLSTTSIHLSSKVLYSCKLSRPTILNNKKNVIQENLKES